MRRERNIYILNGFLLGFIISFIGAIFEDGFHNINFLSSISEVHHYLSPFIIGLVGAVIGFFYEGNKKSKRLAESALQLKNKNLSILLAVSQKFVMSLELDSVLQTIIEQATSLVNLDTGAIYLHEDEKLYLGATTPPLPPNFPEEFRRASLSNHPHIRQALTTGEPIVLEDALKSAITPEEKLICEQRGILSILYIPLILEKTPVGTLILGTTQARRKFTSEEIDMFRAISSSAALVIQNAKMYKESQLFGEELKNQNEEILVINDDLKRSYDQIQKMNLDLQYSKEQAEKNEKLKSVFLNNMSHEVRTPLNAIAGFSQLLTTPSLSPENIIRFSELISKSSDKLLNIVTDIIEVSQIQTKDIFIHETVFDFVNFISRLSDEFIEGLNEHQIKPQLRILPQKNEYWIKSDQYKIGKIFRHLLDNAVKFTEHGKVEVSIHLKDDNIELIFEDTGIGIQQDLHKDIFEPFNQIEPEQGNLYQGNGLGLSIVKGFTISLGGEISMQSEPHKGTKISVALPVKKASLINQTISKIQNFSHKIGTILIAEDEQSNFDYLKEVLSNICLNILHAPNGKEAVEICKNDKDISIVLMDIKMPVMDGLTAAKHIKEIRPELPIIAQSAYATNSDSHSVFTEFFDDYISKPVNAKALLEVLNKYASMTT